MPDDVKSDKLDAQPGPEVAFTMLEKSLMRAIQSADNERSRKPHFDPTINLGHILTMAACIVTMGSAIFTVYMNGELRSQKHDARITALEAASADTKIALGHMAESSTKLAIAQESLSATMAAFLRSQATTRQ